MGAAGDTTGPRLDSASVRIFANSGAVAGAGFVIGPNSIATCAHVVADAVGADPADPRPPQLPVSIDFPLDVRSGRAMARVRRWGPISPGGRGDIAVLEIVEGVAEPLAGPPFWVASQPWGREFRMLGFPVEMDGGMWVGGEFRAPQGAGWLQLQAAAGGQPITPGFSGAAVWDVSSGSVVGMAVAADARRYTRTAFMIPIDEVLGLDPAMLPNPYRGLERFEESDAHLFYGRDADIERVLAVLEQRSFVAVTGRSGTGKSSLLSAGVLPRMRRTGTVVATVRLVGDSAVSPSVHTGDPPALSDFMAGLAQAEHLAPGDCAARLSEQVAGADLLIFLDQLEDLVTADPARARATLRWIFGLVQAEPRIRVVTTLCWEAIGDVIDDEMTHRFDGSTVSLAAMGREQLRQVIRGPVTHSPGVVVDADLVERLVDDTVHEPGGLPLLESMLSQLWDQRRSGRLTLADYHRCGGVGASIAHRAERALAQFADPGSAAAAWRLLLTLAVPSAAGAGFVRSAVLLADVAELRSAAGYLARDRLVVIGRRSDGAELVELAHQALIDNWPRLRERLEYDREFRSWLQTLDHSRRSWAAAQRDSGALLRGGALSVAEDWLAVRAADIPRPHQEYIEASRQVRRREVHRWRAVTAVLTALVVIAASTAVVAYRSSQQRAAQLRLAAGISLAKESIRLADTEPLTALQFAQAAHRHAPGNPEVEAALLFHQAGLGTISDFTPGMPPGEGKGVASRDGSVFAVVDATGAATVVSGLRGRTPRVWRVPAPEPVVGLDLSPDGRKVALFTKSGEVSMWDVHARSGPVTIRGAAAQQAPEGALTGRFSEDGGLFALSWDPARDGLNASPPDVLEIYDTSGRRPVRLNSLPAGALDQYPVDIRADGTRIRFSEFDGTQFRNVVRDIRTGTVITALPDGTATRDHILHCLPSPPDQPTAELAVLDADTGAERFRFRMGRETCASPVTDMADQFVFTADGRDSDTAHIGTLSSLATGATYRIGLARSVGYGALIVTATDRGPVLSMLTNGGLARYAPAATVADTSVFDGEPAVTAWSDDAESVATYSVDNASGAGRLEIAGVGAVQRRLAHTLLVPAPNEVHLGDRPTLRFTPDGRYLIAIGNRPELVIFAAATLEVVHRIALPTPPELGDPTGWRGAATFLGSDEVAALYGGTLTRWRITDGQRVADPLRLWRDQVELERLSSDGGIVELDRPGEILIGSRQGLSVWNTNERRRIRVLDFERVSQMKGMYIDSAEPVVYLARKGATEMWNAEDGTITRPTQPMPSPIDVVGVTDGGLWVSQEKESPDDVEIWDPVRGRITTLKLPDGSYSATVANDVLHVLYRNGTLRINLARASMFAGLCAINNRGYTDGELAQLPIGADSAPPCGD
ncbi:trypsin-like peptidase domain-containing protein [Nocardia sp. NPDC059180]|uniref:nSTAND1 domain-containing NTPase n=1 Tax=Nocardia sp. NPDC059180 TaxID=3346761 RepID=UPI00369ECFB4